MDSTPREQQDDDNPPNAGLKEVASEPPEKSVAIERDITGTDDAESDTVAEDDGQ